MFLKCEARYVTRDVLVRLTEYEKDGFQFNRGLSPEYLDTLEPHLRLPVVLAFKHVQSRGPFEVVVRCMLVCPINGKSIDAEEDAFKPFVDMPVEEFKNLPQLEEAAAA
jgi:hypothetical protein